MLGVVSRSDSSSWLGGKVEWLSGALPTPECGVCGSSLRFVAQISAPINEPRALHIFVCEAHATVDEGWRVLRTQCAAVTHVKDDWGTRASDWEDDDDLEDLLREHENSAAVALPPPPPSTDAFPRSELAWVVEQAHCEDEEEEDEHDEAMLARARAYLAADAELGAWSREAVANAIDRKAMTSVRLDHDDAYEAVRDDQAASLALARRLRSNPKQVLRYAYADKPLRVHSQWTCDPAACVCGAPRRFELEILPTLIFFLHSSKMEDFATVAVFSCDRSCALSSSEVVFVQPLPESPQPP